MLLYIFCFGCLMGLFIHFYIIFGTNLLTGGPAQIAVFFAYFSVLQKKNIKQSPKRMKPSGAWFLEQTWSRGLGVDVKKLTRKPRVGGHAYPLGAPSTLVTPPTYFFLQYIPTYPGNIREHHENLIPSPQPSVPMRSHIGAFSSAPSKGALITEGFYINTIASSMMCE